MRALVAAAAAALIPTSGVHCALELSEGSINGLLGSLFFSKLFGCSRFGENFQQEVANVKVILDKLSAYATSIK